MALTSSVLPKPCFNEAPAKEPGKSPSLCRRCTPRDSFNEAPAKEPGKSRKIMAQHVMRAWRFNEAPAKEPGKRT